MITQPGDAIFPRTGGELCFTRPREVIAACTVREVLPALNRVQAETDAGRWAAGFVSYEAAPAFDPALRVHAPTNLPLVWFGIYDEPAPSAFSGSNAPLEAMAWEPRIERAAYHEAVALIHGHIAAGDTYQVNYTFPLDAPAPAAPHAWWRRRVSAQGGGPCAYVHADDHIIASASPEWFFTLDGDVLTSRPMKGTRPRGRWPEEDTALATELRASDKERAENVMIVDMVRNDMGRIAETGSVSVPALFEAERYETVWQMTSTVTARTHAGLAGVFSALFPPASVTGAPKVETMKIIHALEPYPRGVYCGAVGWAGPGRQASFNVAIRTATIDTRAGRATYAVGSGITHDATAEAEYEECLHKAAVLSHDKPGFELLESLLWDDGFFLLEEHLERLAGSADYFGIPLDLHAIRRALHDAVEEAEGRRKVRLLVDQAGSFQIEHAPAAPVKPVRVGLAAQPVDARDIFLFHKATHREVYRRALESRPGCDDVLLWNERGELTESCMANLVVVLGGEKFTPPIACGLLGGTFRRHLLASGEVAERVITKADLKRADALWLINSVRQWIPVVLVDA